MSDSTSMLSSLFQNLREYEEQQKQLQIMIGDMDKNIPEYAQLIEAKEQLDQVIQMTTDSILQLKKAVLLQQIEQKSTSPPTTSTSTTSTTTTTSTSTSTSNPNPSTKHILHDIGDMISCLYINRMNGSATWNDAKIISIRENQDQHGENHDIYTVIFPYPTHASMRTCHTWSTTHTCRYGNECRYNHGIDVEQQHIRELNQRTVLNVKDNCLARYHDDDLWFPATVMQVMGDPSNRSYCVQYTGYPDQEMVPASDVTYAPESIHHEAEEEEHPSDIDNPAITRPAVATGMEIMQNQDVAAAISSWSSHTTGFGLRLLARLGYTPGQGLGSKQQGIVAPIVPHWTGRDTRMGLDGVSDRVAEKESIQNGTAASDLTASFHRDSRKRRYDDIQSSSSSNDVFSFLNTTLTNNVPTVATSTSQLTSAVDAHSTMRLRKDPKHAKSSSKSSPSTSRPTTVVETGKQLLSCRDALRDISQQLISARAAVARNKNTSMESLFQQKLQNIEQKEIQLKQTIIMLEKSMTMKQQHQQRMKF